MIEAVFWDYDNTILETAEAHWSKHQMVLEQCGIRLDEKYRQRIYENNGAQNWEWIALELGLKKPKQEYLDEIDALFHAEMKMFAFRPGVEKLFQLFEEKGIPQAIVTNARRESAKPVLEAKGLTKRMTFILYKEDYEGRKPDPTPYLAALKKMGVKNPGSCLAIEDDPKGVESAHKAGLKVIHRKLKKDDPDSPYANFCCFEEDDFLQKVAEASSLVPQK